MGSQFSTILRRLTAAVLLASAGLLISGAAQATLIDRGGGMIYDSDLDITWLADANLGAGSAYDNGISTTDGRMTWDSAVAWAASLSYGGYDDWRLPTALNANGSGPCSGYNCTGSEIGHLFYVELGGTAGSSILSSSDPDLALFTNIHNNSYWSGTEKAAPISPGAWMFAIHLGGQGTFSYPNNLYAWAVRSGDVAAVPEPATLLLLGLGLAGLGYSRRRKT